MSGIQAFLSQGNAPGAAARAVAASRSWLDDLVRDEGERIVALLWKILRDEQDVHDAFQDTFCKLAAIGASGVPKNPRAYAIRTASNVAIEMIRSRTRRGAHRDAIREDRRRIAGERTEASQGDRRNDSRELSAGDPALQAAIAELPPHLRSVVVLRDLGQRSYDEVGRLLGIEPTTARVYRRQAILSLTKSLGRAHDKEDG